MRKFEVVSKYKNEGINLPKRATRHSAGYDIESAVDIVIPPHPSFYDIVLDLTLEESKEWNKKFKNAAIKIKTGLKVYLEDNEYLDLSLRSSIGCNNLLVIPQGSGKIDADYVDNKDNEGEIMITVINLSPCNLIIKKGDRIAQGIFCKYNITDDDEVVDSQIRNGGFGSTNK